MTVIVATLAFSSAEAKILTVSKCVPHTNYCPILRKIEASRAQYIQHCKANLEAWYAPRRPYEHREGKIRLTRAQQERRTETCGDAYDTVKKVWDS